MQPFSARICPVARHCRRVIAKNRFSVGIAVAQANAAPLTKINCRIDNHKFRSDRTRYTKQTWPNYTTTLPGRNVTSHPRLATKLGSFAIQGEIVGLWVGSLALIIINRAAIARPLLENLVRASQQLDPPGPQQQSSTAANRQTPLGVVPGARPDTGSRSSHDRPEPR